MWVSTLTILTTEVFVSHANAPLTPEFKRWVKENHAEIRHVTRANTNGQAFFIEDRSVWDVTPEQRRALYEAA